MSTEPPASTEPSSLPLTEPSLPNEPLSSSPAELSPALSSSCLSKPPPGRPEPSRVEPSDPEPSPLLSEQLPESSSSSRVEPSPLDQSPSSNEPWPSSTEPPHSTPPRSSSPIADECPSPLPELPSTVTPKEETTLGAPLPSSSESDHSAALQRISNGLTHASEKDVNTSSSGRTSSDSTHPVASGEPTPSPASVIVPSPAEPVSVAQTSRLVSHSPPEAGPSDTRRSMSAGSFVSSPLNPTTTPSPLLPFARQRLSSTRSSIRISRIASEESRVLSRHFPSSPLLGDGSGPQPQRGSMILYRLAETQDGQSFLSPPVLPRSNRISVVSMSGESVLSLSSDSKYPCGVVQPGRHLVAYPYDPTMDENLPGDEEQDLMHDPKPDITKRILGISWRGMGNVGSLTIMVMALLALFIVYPVVQVLKVHNARSLIAENPRINSTGQLSDIVNVSSNQSPIRNGETDGDN